MKKKVLLLYLSITFILFVSFAIAADNSTACASGDNSCKVDKAYSCLNDKIDSKTCSSLSPDEKVFSLMATGKCINDVLNDSKYKSDLKFTSESLIGLHNSGSDTQDAQDWIKSQERSSIGLNWFLEIESPQKTTCTIGYSNSNSVVIDENKKITSLTGGGCLSLAQGNYWLEINPNCYNENFTISCDQQFLTTLLYQKQNSNTVYVSQTTHSSSAQGETTEKVNSLCFKSGSSCDYEGSLWAALALSTEGKDVNSYLPYLITNAPDNENLLPESFLYQLTGNDDFKNTLLSKQINNKWWVSSNDKYYGTALALYPLKYEDSQQKTDSMDWLLNDVQGTDGCWNSGDIKNTAFILASIWPRSFTATGSNASSLIDCEASGYYCSSRINCDTASVLSNYYCSGTFVCCSQKQQVSTCSEQGGSVCNSNQKCVGVGSVSVDASDISGGEICCVSGTCSDVSNQTQVSSCESSGGICRTSGCNTNENEVFELSCSYNDICCKPKQTTSSGISVWVWILLGLIVLVVLGIIFRDKLRRLLLRIKSGFGKGSSKGSGPRGPPGRPPFFRPPRGFMPQRRALVPRRASSEKPGELDDVIKKLKEIGK